MKTIQLPQSGSSKVIDKIVLSTDLVVGTTIGLIKGVNEDSLACSLSEAATRLCIADGHWGDTAAELIATHWMRTDITFPGTRDAAIRQTERIESGLFQRLGSSSMDATRDFTPEAAFIATEVRDRTLQIVSYGDCRLLIVREDKILFELATKATWLGAFSHLALRDRTPVKDAMIFEEVQLEINDTILLFTDGVDECVYEKPTISNERIADIVGTLHDPSLIFDTLMAEVFEHGAEDNASLSVLRIPT